MNPVRAKLVRRPGRYRWSSAAAHLKGRDDGLVRVRPLLELAGDWAKFLSLPTEAKSAEKLQAHERTGRPLGSDAFVAKLERRLRRVLRPRKAGRKRKPAPRRRAARK